MQALLLLDTNVYLHARPFHNLPWIDLARSLDQDIDDVVLAVPPVVLDELEHHRTFHVNEELRMRAESALERMTKVFGVDPSKDAVIDRRIVARLLRNRAVEIAADYRLQDEQLFGSLNELRAQYADCLVALVTRDRAAKLRAWQRGFPCLDLPNEFLLAAVRDGRRSSGPKVDVVVTLNGLVVDDTPPTTVVIDVPRNPTESEIEREGDKFLRTLAGTDPAQKFVVKSLLQNELAAHRRDFVAQASARRDAARKLSGSISVVNAGGVQLHDVAVSELDVVQSPITQTPPHQRARPLEDDYWSKRAPKLSPTESCRFPLVLMLSHEQVQNEAEFYLTIRFRIVSAQIQPELERKVRFIVREVEPAW